jgi:hypothetical protein
MLKPGLGKGLGDLMKGDQVAGKDRSPESVSEPTPDFGRGLKTLLKVDQPAFEPERAPKRSLVPPWFYFAADLLLLAYTVAIALDASRPFEVSTILFCVVSVTFGGILAIVGVLQSSNGD